jgi:hypothetical protein
VDGTISRFIDCSGSGGTAHIGSVGAVRCNARAAFYCGAGGNIVSPPVDGMTMNTGLYRSELTGLARVGGDFSGSPSDPPENTSVKYFRRGFIWLPVILIAGLGAGAWMLLSGYSGNTAESEPVRLVTAVATEPAPSSGPDMGQDGSPLNPAATPPLEAIAPVEAAPIDGLKISSQSWRRGGLGSKALVTFTIRNGNDYAVKDIAISCAFTRRDGSHLTDRTRTVHDIVDMKSRRTFARMHVGFVNINANRAKCSLVNASRI